QGIGIFIVMWVLSLEIIQIWLEGRSADVTPALTCALLVPPIIRLARSKVERGTKEGAAVHSPPQRKQRRCAPYERKPSLAPDGAPSPASGRELGKRL
ncbi:MAG: hypothetical protein LBF50_07005, partial [Azoarcus sp.]|nr:hypothetical protein [Azoarcus sp.]